MVLSDNYISDSSAGAFADVGSSGCTVTSLDLDMDNNRLGDGMARALALAVHWATTIVKLSLA